MKIFLVSLFFLLFCFQIKAQQTDYNKVIVVDLDDSTTINGTLLGKVQFKEKIITVNCSYDEVLNVLKKEALAKGGNLIHITEHKYPDVWSTCHRVKADVYNVADPVAYQKEIYWSTDKKLDWKDFKGTVSDAFVHSDYGAMSYCMLGFNTNRVTVYKKAKFFITSKFSCYESWAKEVVINDDYALKHEQIHFDICEIYARTLYKVLTEAKLTAFNLQDAQPIFNTIYKEYRAREEQYDVETKHSLNKEEQQRWNLLVAQELDSLSAYSNYPR